MSNPGKGFASGSWGEVKVEFTSSGLVPSQLKSLQVMVAESVVAVVHALSQPVRNPFDQVGEARTLEVSKKVAVDNKKIEITFDVTAKHGLLTTAANRIEGLSNGLYSLLNDPANSAKQPPNPFESILRMSAHLLSDVPSSGFLPKGDEPFTHLVRSPISDAMISRLVGHLRGEGPGLFGSAG